LGPSAWLPTGCPSSDCGNWLFWSLAKEQDAAVPNISQAFRTQPQRPWSPEEYEDALHEAQQKAEEAEAELARRNEIAKRAREEAREARHRSFDLQRAADEAALQADRMESRSRVADDMVRQATSAVERTQERLQEIEDRHHFEG
jgi:hypothetical protein